MSLKEQRTGAEGSPRSEVAFEDVPIARSLRRSVGSSPERCPIRSRGPSLIVVWCVPVTRRNRCDLGSADPARRLISRFRIRPRRPIPCVTSTRRRRRTRRSGREVDGSRQVGPRSHHTGDRSIRPTLLDLDHRRRRYRRPADRIRAPVWNLPPIAMNGRPLRDGRRS